MTRLLASVRSAAEAKTAVAGGADLVDAKDPARGALGALDFDAIREIVAAVGGARPVSATVGDLPLDDPRSIVSAVERLADTGADLLKIGLFAGPGRTACLPPLEPLARRQPLVAVLFVDQDPDLELIPRIAGAGFAGVMLDTADKNGGPLTARVSLTFLGDFVRTGRHHGLLVGLAGSLGPADVPCLLPFGADYLGFRGALCANGRLGDLDLARLEALVRLIRDEAWPPPNPLAANIG
jgi:uncharacterized protein (UPF0264 family)